MTWLVTGGAGYIGSHVVRAFTADGIAAVVIDDLSSGHRSFVRPDVPFYEGSVLHDELLDQIFTEHTISGVVHLAGFKYAGVSVSRPLHTYSQNITGMVSLLESMAAHDVTMLCLLLERSGLRHTHHGPGQRTGPDGSGVPLRGVQTGRRVGAPRPGAGNRVQSSGAAPHLTALLQCRWFRL